jgi:hypothetical protein
VTQTRAADDFATIRARMEELRREQREGRKGHSLRPGARSRVSRVGQVVIAPGRLRCSAG